MQQLEHGGLLATTVSAKGLGIGFPYWAQKKATRNTARRGKVHTKNKNITTNLYKPRLNPYN